MFSDSFTRSDGQGARSDIPQAMSETLVDSAVVDQVATTADRAVSETADQIPAMAKTVDEIPAMTRIMVTVPPSKPALSLGGRVVQRATTNSQGVAKVVIDFALSVLLALVIAPIVLVTALAVKLSSRGPVFYSQTRVGRSGRPFTIYKIRTMIHDCESLTGARWCTVGDSRITPIGSFLRRTHLDELPQLWNILRGDMSLVGPRPERPEFVPQLAKAIAGYRERLLVRPGVTGLAQVQLPPDSDMESVRKKLAFDLYYIEHASLFLDLRLVLCTACSVVGIPFAVMGRLLCVPSGEQIEHAYETAVTVRGVVPEMELQPA